MFMYIDVFLLVGILRRWFNCVVVCRVRVGERRCLVNVFLDVC